MTGQAVGKGWGSEGLRLNGRRIKPFYLIQVPVLQDLRVQVLGIFAARMFKMDIQIVSRGMKSLSVVHPKLNKLSPTFLYSAFYSKRSVTLRR